MPRHDRLAPAASSTGGVRSRVPPPPGIDAIRNAVHQQYRRLRSLTHTSNLLRDTRQQVYALSKMVGINAVEVNRQMALDKLREWREAPDRATQTSIERELAVDCSLLVTDMSGFTRITREEGILHFLMLIKQMQAICLPIFSRYGGTLLKVEADDLFVLFPSPMYAIQAAQACLEATQAYSRTKARKNDRIVLSCGIIDGPMWTIPHLDAFGETVELGFRLGEDLAGSNEILCHRSVKTKVATLEGDGEESVGAYVFTPAAPLEFEGQRHELFTARYTGGAVKGAVLASDAADDGGQPFSGALRHRPRRRGGPIARLLRCCSCCGADAGAHVWPEQWQEEEGGGGASGDADWSMSLTCVISAVVNQEEPLDLIGALDERMELCAAGRMAAVAQVDARIIKRFLRRRVTVLVVMIHIKTPGGLRGEELRTISSLLEIKALAQRVVTSHGGTCVQAMQVRAFPAVFALMPTATAALESVGLLLKLTQAQRRADVVFRAGLATGEVLDFDGCNAFGDPVNTAFKLGEDLSADWEICVDPTAHMQLPPPLRANLPFVEKSAAISGVEIGYLSMDAASERGRAATAKVRLVRYAHSGDGGLASAATVAATPGMLDWTELVGRGVRELRLPYGDEQELAASRLQARHRANAVRRAHGGSDNRGLGLAARDAHLRSKLASGKAQPISLFNAVARTRWQSAIAQTRSAVRVISATSKSKAVRSYEQRAPWSVEGQKLLAMDEQQSNWCGNGYGASSPRL